jgi:transposase
MPPGHQWHLHRLRESCRWRALPAGYGRTNCRIKDFRAIATRYDKLARNFLAGLCLVTALLYW